jgi:hypothetical protein
MNGKNIAGKKEGVEDPSPELMFDKFELGKQNLNLRRIVRPTDSILSNFPADLDIYGTDETLRTSLDCSDDLSATGTEKVLGVPKVPKNDIRRHLPKMLLNAINCGDFPMTLGYLNTLMAPNAKWAMEYMIKTPLKTKIRKMAAEGPRLSAFYISAMNVMFPDMVLSFTSCKLITSNMWPGSQLILEGDFHATQMYDISLQHAGLLFIRLYHKKVVQIWECMEQMSLNSPEVAVKQENSESSEQIPGAELCATISNTSTTTADSATNSTADTIAIKTEAAAELKAQGKEVLTPTCTAANPTTTRAASNASVKTIPVAPMDPIPDDPLLPRAAAIPDPDEEDQDQRKGRRKYQKVSTITSTSADERAMILQVHEIFRKTPLLATPREIHTKCTFVFQLDAKHVIEDIRLTATEEFAAAPESKK